MPTPPTTPAPAVTPDPDAEWLQQQGNLRSIASEATRKAWGPAPPLIPERNDSAYGRAQVAARRRLPTPWRHAYDSAQHREIANRSKLALDRMAPPPEGALMNTAALPIRPYFGTATGEAGYVPPLRVPDPDRLPYYERSSGGGDRLWGLPEEDIVPVLRRAAQRDDKYAPWIQHVVDWIDADEPSQFTWMGPQRLRPDAVSGAIGRMLAAAQENDPAAFMTAFHQINAVADNVNSMRTYDPRPEPVVEGRTPAVRTTLARADFPDMPPWYAAYRMVTDNDPRFNPTPVKLHGEAPPPRLPPNLQPDPWTLTSPRSVAEWPAHWTEAPYKPEPFPSIPTTHWTQRALKVPPPTLSQPTLPVWMRALSTRAMREIADRLGAAADNVIEAVNPQIQPQIAVPGWAAALQLGAARDTADTAYPLAMPILAPHQVYSINPERD